jgi:hypothetical protein
MACPKCLRPTPHCTCGAYVPVMERNHWPTANQEMHRLLDECARLGEENAALRTTMQQVLADAQAQDVLPEWWPMMERALKTPNVRGEGQPTEGREPRSCASGLSPRPKC